MLVFKLFARMSDVIFGARLPTTPAGATGAPACDAGAACGAAIPLDAGLAPVSGAFDAAAGAFAG
jgi:hypothetical protein